MTTNNYEALLVKVLINSVGDDGLTDSETLWAHSLGEGCYRLANLPFYAYDLSLDDIIKAPIDESTGLPTFEKILNKSGNRTLRVILDPPAVAGEKSHQVLEDLIKIGCSVERASLTYAAINVPVEVALGSVVTLLNNALVKWERADA